VPGRGRPEVGFGLEAVEAAVAARAHRAGLAHRAVGADDARSRPALGGAGALARVFAEVVVQAAQHHEVAQAELLEQCCEQRHLGA
jgi:hypothetical protein